MSKTIMIFGALFVASGVLLGAFAAHALSLRLDEYALSVFETGVRYQMYHGLALLFLSLLSLSKQSVLVLPSWCVPITALLLGIGVGLFSGSLYLLAVSGIRWLGIITPIGGFCFIIGWAVFIWCALRAE